MNITEQLEALSLRHSDINSYTQQLLLQSVGQTAFDVVHNEKSKVKPASNVYHSYEVIEQYLVESFGLLNDMPKKDKFNADNTSSQQFLKEVQGLLISDLQRKAEYEQLILVANTMDKYAAFMRAAGLLKTTFQHSEETQNKMKM